MNPIAHLTNKKFKELTAIELLEVVTAYLDENHYNCTEEYISFEKWFRLRHFTRDFKRKNVIEYFEDNYYSIDRLKDFFKYWVI